MAITDTLLERLLEYDPDFPTDDPRFVRLVLNPMITLLAEDLPSTDPQALIEARMTEESPDVDGSVFADLMGKVVASVFLPLEAVHRSHLSRRRMDDERLLSQSDLLDQRDFCFVDPSEGTFANGTVRAYYTVPRALSFDPAMRVYVPSKTGGPARTYRFAQTYFFTLEEVRANTSGGLYYVDVRLVAVEPGAEFTLQVGDAKGAVGFPGASRVTNTTKFRDGTSSDDVASLFDRIRTSLRRRGMSTRGGATNTLQTMGASRYLLILGGDELMLRDRIYGPGTISGIPGGLLSPPKFIPETGDTPFVRLGIAYDIFAMFGDSARTTAVQVTNAYDAGAEVIAGFDGVLSWDDTVADPAHKYTLLTRPSRFTETVGVPREFPEWPGDLRPVQEGDVLVFEGLFRSDSSGARIEFAVTNVGASGRELRLDPIDSLDPVDFGAGPGDTSFQFPGSSYAVRRRVLVRTDPEIEDHSTEYRALSFPITDPRAYQYGGAEYRASGVPAAVRPATADPDYFGASLVPQTRNVVEDAELLPILYPDRVELAGALSGNESGDYMYPRQFLYAEFQNSTAGAAALKAVMVRVHLLGPQAAALPSGCWVRNSTESTQLFPLFWEWDTAETQGDGPETDTIFLGVGFSVDELQVPGGEIIEGRYPQAGDWAHFFDSGASYILPITGFSAADGLITVAAPDLPNGLTGTVRVYQGTSRATQLSAGRGPEGTYSFDVWCGESTEVGYTAGDPPTLGEKAYIDPRAYLAQGFDVVSPLPGHKGGVTERLSVVMHGGYGNDGEQLSGRSLILHSNDTARLEELQELIDSDDERPMGMQGLVKAFAPAYVVLAFYYTADDLAPATAAAAFAAALDEANTDQRLELSGLIDAVQDAGADWVVNGRLFVARLNHLRQWEYLATKGAVNSLRPGRFILQAVTAVRLDERAVAESLDRGTEFSELDPSNWVGSYTHRGGVFDAD